MRSARMTVLLGLLATGMVACPGPSKTPIDEPRHFVPWVATLPTLSPVTEPSPGVPSGTKPCTAAMLRFGSFGPGGAAAGTYYTSSGIRNVATEHCFVDRRTTVRFLDDRGREVQHQRPVGIEPQSGVVIPATPEAQTMLRLGVSNVCPPLPSSTMEITFAPDGSRRRVTLPPGLGQTELGPDCGSEADRGSYFADFVAEPPPTPELSPSPLIAKIQTFEPPRAGARFRYFVVLANPTPVAVPLEPCPIYNESVMKSAFGTYELNCSTVRSIPAQSSVTYEMFIDVPPEIRPDDRGRILLTWGFDGSAGPSTHAWIELN